MDLGRHQEACAAFNSAIQLGPESATAHYGLGLALWSNDADAEALTAFERSLMIDDDRAEAHVGRANVLATLGRDQEAVAALRKALIRGFCDLEALHLSEALLGDDGRRDLRQLLDSWGLLDQYDAPTDTPGMTVEDLKIDSGPLPGKE
jgi:tetratricopeptide (TPR) repeat protein